MYTLPYYKEHDENVITHFISQYPFAFLSGCDAQLRPIATQLPVFIETRGGKKILRGHIMKNTDHHKGFLQNDNVLVVFTGRHTYVSATWYTNPNIASTWNYMSVQAKGVITFLDDQGLEDVLRLTSLHFEGYNKESSTVYDNLPKEYTQRLQRAIVAFEIEVAEMETTFKLSQDRDAESYQNIIDNLKTQDADGQAIASEMEKRKKQVFPEN